MRKMNRVLALGATVLCGLASMGGGPARGGEPDAREKAWAGFRLVRVLKGHTKPGVQFSISPNGKLLATAGDITLRIWDVNSGKEIRKEVLNGEMTLFPLFLPGGKDVLCCCAPSRKDYDGLNMHMYRFDGPLFARRSKHVFLKENENLDCLAASPDGKLLAIGTSGTLSLWKIRAGKRLWKISLRRHRNDLYGEARQLAFMPDGQTVVALLWDMTVRLVGVRSGKELQQLRDPTARSSILGGMALSPTGKLLAVGMGGENLLRLWNPMRGQSLREIRWGEQFPRERRLPLRERRTVGMEAVALSADEKTVAAACCDNKVRLWEVATGRLRCEAKLIDPFRLAFFPKGRLLATTSGDSHIHLWDWRLPAAVLPPRLTDGDLRRFWRDLGSPDATIAYRAMASLASAPGQTVALLGKRLRPSSAVSPVEIDRLIGNLNADNFEERERATEGLATLGEAARVKLCAALVATRSAEVRDRTKGLLSRLDAGGNPEHLQSLRSVELLEYIATPEARAVIQKLTGGASGMPQTEDARAALKRLNCGTK